LISSYSRIMRKDYLTTFLAAGFFLAGAFFATFFAGAFFTVAFLVAFFAGAFLAGISYPPFHSAVAEDKTQITIGLTNEHSRQRQSEIVATLIFRLNQKCFFAINHRPSKQTFPLLKSHLLIFAHLVFVVLHAVGTVANAARLG
jgi:hypothetical protein